MRGQIFPIIMLSMVLVFGQGCSFGFQDIEFEKGKKALNNNKSKEAIQHFRRVIQKDQKTELAVKAARLAGRVTLFETKNFQKSLYFYDFLVKHSPREEERLEAQEIIASIYFEKLNDYQSAITEYTILFNNLKGKASKDLFEYRFNIAKSYFHLNNFYQAKTELRDLLNSQELTDDQRIELLLFQGRLYLTTRKVDKAISTYEKVLNKYPERAKKENVVMQLALGYEEKQEFAKAIALLDSIKSDYPDPEFLDLKIQRLQQRKRNLPESDGLQK